MAGHMAIMGRMNSHIEKILEYYPNFLNNDHVVDCTWENEDERKAPFIRILPKFFAVKEVNYWRKRDGCYYVVKYNFDNGDDLPTGNGLKPLVNQIKKYSPANTVIVDDDIEPPKCVVVTYVVCCRCSRLDFEPSIKVWALQNAMEKFHM